MFKLSYINLIFVFLLFLPIGLAKNDFSEQFSTQLSALNDFFLTRFSFSGEEYTLWFLLFYLLTSSLIIYTILNKLPLFNSLSEAESRKFKWVISISLSLALAFGTGVLYLYEWLLEVTSLITSPFIVYLVFFGLWVVFSSSNNWLHNEHKRNSRSSTNYSKYLKPSRNNDNSSHNFNESHQVNDFKNEVNNGSNDSIKSDKNSSDFKKKNHELLNEIGLILKELTKIYSATANQLDKYSKLYEDKLNEMDSYLEKIRFINDSVNNRSNEFNDNLRQFYEAAKTLIWSIKKRLNPDEAVSDSNLDDKTERARNQLIISSSDLINNLNHDHIKDNFTVSFIRKWLYRLKYQKPLQISNNKQGQLLLEDKSHKPLLLEDNRNLNNSGIPDKNLQKSFLHPINEILIEIIEIYGEIRSLEKSSQRLEIKNKKIKENLIKIKEFQNIITDDEVKNLIANLYSKGEDILILIESRIRMKEMNPIKSKNNANLNQNVRLLIDIIYSLINKCQSSHFDHFLLQIIIKRVKELEQETYLLE